MQVLLDAPIGEMLRVVLEEAFGAGAEGMDSFFLNGVKIDGTKTARQVRQSKGAVIRSLGNGPRWCGHVHLSVTRSSHVVRSQMSLQDVSKMKRRIFNVDAKRV